MFQYKLLISYDGTSYFGWQKTNVGPSIQEIIETAILKIGENGPLPEAASRTDRGVHASGQIVAIILQKLWDPKTLQKALNSRLPLDIRILKVENVSLDFHPTLMAIEKEYHYHCCLNPVQEPPYRLYSWHFHKPLNIGNMKTGIKKLLGTCDFTTFTNSPKENPFCTLHRIEIAPLPEKRLRISIQGDRFLYKMARNLVGTLMHIGTGKLSPDQIPSLIASRDRKQAPMTAPAHGLILHQVNYKKL